jgi:hypothetical protein
MPTIQVRTDFVSLPRRVVLLVGIASHLHASREGVRNHTACLSAESPIRYASELFVVGVELSDWTDRNMKMIREYEADSEVGIWVSVTQM